MNPYSDVQNVDADTTHILFAGNALLCCPLETSHARILDFVEVLDSLRRIDQQIGSICVGAETPDPAGVSHIPPEFVSEDTSPELEIVVRFDRTTFDGFAEVLIEGRSLDIDTIVLVRRF